MFRVFVHGLKLIKTRTVALVKSILKTTRKGTPISSKNIFHSSFRKKLELLLARGKEGVILNPSAIQDSFKIFDGSFERLKNVRKILHLVALGYLVNYFHIEMDLGLFGEVSSSNMKPENN